MNSIAREVIAESFETALEASFRFDKEEVNENTTDDSEDGGYDGPDIDTLHSAVGAVNIALNPA